MSHDNIAHLDPLTNVPITYQLLTLYSFCDIAWTKFYSQSHYGKVNAHLHPQTNVPNKFQLPTPYGF